MFNVRSADRQEEIARDRNDRGLARSRIEAQHHDNICAGIEVLLLAADVDSTVRIEANCAVGPDNQDVERVALFNGLSQDAKRDIDTNNFSELVVHRLKTGACIGGGRRDQKSSEKQNPLRPTPPILGFSRHSARHYQRVRHR